MSSDKITVHKEMGLTHDDLFRLLPTLAEPDNFTVSEQQIVISNDDQVVTIDYAKERTRKIASFELPVTDLDFVFSGFDQQQVKEFITKFDRIYQRGGG